MKKNLIKVVTVSTIFAFGVGFLANQFQRIEPLEATQHAENYDAYTYSGNYYSTINDSLTGGLQGTLRKSLSTLILPKAWYGYSGSSNGQLGKELQSADQDPTNSANMVLFYTRDSVTKRSSGGSTTDWNREHVWPQSLSNGHWGKTEAGADLLHIRPTWYSTNNKRGNTVYGDVNKANPQTYDGMTYAYTSGSYFEPIDAVKGDVARILMYVYTAYVDYYNDSNLYVIKAIESYDTLLKWHTLDKPDALEGSRNNFSESSVQKNRNPFVDHPEYAWKIFGDSCSAEVKNSCMEAYPVGGNPNTTPTSSSSEAPVTSSSSSEPIVVSSSEVSSSQEPSSSQQQPKAPGCFGALTIVPIISVGAIFGITIIFSKRKKK